MDSSALTQYISDLLEKIYYLADASQKKCQVLSDISNTIIRCKHTLNLCTRIQKNSSYFEKELIKEALKFNIRLETEDADSSGCVSDVSQEDNKKDDSTEGANKNESGDNGLTISMKFGSIVETEKFLHLNSIDISKFWLDLKKFTESYLSTEIITNKEEIKQSTCTQTEIVLEEALEIEDPVLRQIKEIFGSDSELDQSKTGGRSGNIKSQNYLKNEKSLDNQIEKISTNISGNDASMTSQMKIQDKEVDGKETEKDREATKNVTDNPDQQIIPQQSTNFKEPMDKVENVKSAETEKDKQDENEAERSAFEITASLQEEFESIMNVDCNDQNPQKSPPPKDNSSKNVCSFESSVSIDGILKAVDAVQATDSIIIEDTVDVRVSQSEKVVSTNEVCSPKDPPVSSEASTSQLIHETDSGSRNSDVEIEPSISGSISEKHTEGSQITISSNIEEEVKEDLSGTQTATSRNTLQHDSESGLDGTQDATTNNIEDKHEKNLEATEAASSSHIEAEDQASDPEATQIVTHIQIEGKDKGSDSPKKKEFLSGLGLALSDVHELSKVLAEVRCDEADVSETGSVGEGGSAVDQEAAEYSDEEVADALQYFQQSDSSSESVSVKSVRSDSLFRTDSDEDTNVNSDSGFSRTTRSASKKKIEEQLSKRETTSEKSSPGKLSTPDHPKVNFVSKDFYVKVERIKIDSLVEKTSNSDTASPKNADLDEKKFVIKDCFVKLEHLRLLQVSSDSDDEMTASSDDEVDKLCDLSSLKRKKKERDGSVDSAKKKKRNIMRIKRKRRIVNLSGSETSDLTGFSSISEDEIAEQRGGIFDQGFEHQERIATAVDPNELLTEIVCHTIHDSASSSSDSESNEDVKVRKKSNHNAGDKKIKDEGELSKKASWRDDPLLTGKLDLPSDKVKMGNIKKCKKRKKSDSSTNGSDSDERIEKKSKKLKQLDPNWESDELSSGSSSGDEFDEKPYRDASPMSKMKDDSDIEFVNDEGTPSKTSVINLDSDEDQDKKPGRRNILSVLLSTQLTQETRKAAKEEEERIFKLEMRNQMRTSQSQISTEDCLILDTSSESYNLTVDPVLSKRLLPHQVDGVKFMWDACYLSLDSLETFEGTGCILAHNMGLGKTFQVVTLVHTLFSHSITNTKHVLIVCPLSTVSGWRKELNLGVNLAANKMRINIISIESSDDSDSKCAKINKWKNKGGVLIVGYEAFEKLTNLKKNNTIKAEFLRKALVKPGPDLVVCDEGHLLKNGKALRTRALMEIQTKRRIALTGTPLQNNLSEYYFMVQFVKPNLLGTKHEFNRQFVNPIMNGQYEDSDVADITLMKKRTHVLHRLLKNTVQRYEATELQKYTENMKDYALFIQLHPVQEELYRYYVEMAKARKNVKSKKALKNFFKDYQLTKFICSHPQLLYTMEKQNAHGKKKIIKEKDIISEEPEVQEVEGIPVGWWKSKCPEDVKTSIDFGTKLQVMMGIIEEAEKIGEKVLIFTSSLVELSSIEYFLKLKGTPSCPSWKPRNDYFRMDGTVAPSVRTQMCEVFNNKNNKKLRVFLMSHKVGGLGLNLVAANRVILLGANFNPSHDSQSIFRAYRFGQQKRVYIYRLLSMGTMEEKIYHRCVTKLAIASRVVDKHQIARHYKNLDLDDLYTVAVDLSLERTIPSKPEDDLLSNVLLRFDCIYKYHQHQKLLENRPNEDLNEEDQIKAWEEFKQMNVQNKNPPENANKSSSQNKTTNLTDLVHMRWNQLNVAGPSRADVAPNPLAGLAASQLEQLDKFLYSAGNHFLTPIDEDNRNLVPNPMTFSKTLEINGDAAKKNDAQQSDILQNVSNNQPAGAVSKKSETKRKTTGMGPNPYVLEKLKKKKENVSAAKGTGVTPWRTTSSDDFQKPTGSKHPKWNLPTLKDSSTKTAMVQNKRSRSSSLAKMLREFDGAKKKADSSATSVTVDDDDVIVIDSPEKKTRADDDNGVRAARDAIRKLNKNISVTFGNKKLKKKDSGQSDACKWKPTV